MGCQDMQHQTISHAVGFWNVTLKNHNTMQV